MEDRKGIWMNKKKVMTVVLFMAILLLIGDIIVVKGTVWMHAKGNANEQRMSEEFADETGIQESTQKETTQVLQSEEDVTKTDTADIEQSLVRIAVKQSAGMGIIWAVTEDNVVIASNRHVLTGDVEAQVTFADGEQLTAEALGYSAQYDIAFFQIRTGQIPQELLWEIAEVKRPLEIAWQERTQSGTAIVQADSEEAAYQGTIHQIQYIPEFGTDMLVTSCYAKAGMSGGGVFDEEGWLLGMITGGEAAGSGQKEAWITYSIPSPIIEQEYKLLVE